jgi:hypothetical protein
MDSPSKTSRSYRAGLESKLQSLHAGQEKQTWTAQEVKHPDKTERLIGKYRPMRHRDFTSQITSLPGPRNILTREVEEREIHNYKRKYDVKKRDLQSYVSNIDDKHNAHKIDMKVFPSHKKEEVPLDPSPTRKGYGIKQFILREKYDFLYPEKPCEGKI